MKRLSDLKTVSKVPLALGRHSNPRCGPDFDIHLHFDGSRRSSSRLFWSVSFFCFFVFGFFHHLPLFCSRVSPLGITLSVVQTKWPLYTQQAIRSARAIDEVCIARMPFSAIFVGNTICSKAENFMPIQKPNQMPFTCVCVWGCGCVCVSVCVNFLIES